MMKQPIIPFRKFDFYPKLKKAGDVRRLVYKLGQSYNDDKHQNWSK